MRQLDLTLKARAQLAQEYRSKVQLEVQGTIKNFRSIWPTEQGFIDAHAAKETAKLMAADRPQHLMRQRGLRVSGQSVRAPR